MAAFLYFISNSGRIESQDISSLPEGLRTIFDGASWTAAIVERLGIPDIQAESQNPGPVGMANHSC